MTYDEYPPQPVEPEMGGVETPTPDDELMSLEQTTALTLFHLDRIHHLARLLTGGERLVIYTICRMLTIRERIALDDKPATA